MTTDSVAATVIARLADDYRRRGYAVEVAPRGDRIPEFLEDFQPDLIARRDDDRVIVEVKVGTRTSTAERFRDVAERIDREPGWRFSLVFVNPDEPDAAIEARPIPLPLLEQLVNDAESLLSSGRRAAAFLVFWSALEGLLRQIADRAHLPLATVPSASIVRELYSAGEISRAQFADLMKLLPTRNRLVHGVGPQETIDVERLREIVRALLGELQSA